MICALVWGGQKSEGWIALHPIFVSLARVSAYAWESALGVNSKALPLI